VVSLAGKTLGKYRLIEQLGRGGFASVYKAYQARLDRYVAVKVLHPHLVEGEDFLARFEREAKAVATLRHPNIVIVHDFDVEDNIYYMVMEFIDGQSLKEKLLQLNASQTYMPLATIEQIMKCITEALDYAHDRGMLHRDVKPSNVILDTKGEAFLTDFGIARILSNTQFTATGALIGTPAYMSPEQGQGLGVSPASDVYSLGVMLYEFLTGHVPFDADTPLAIIFKHISDPLPSIRTTRPELPEGLERVVYKALAKDPDDRFQRPGEMMVVLADVLKELSQPEAPATPTTIAEPVPGEDIQPQPESEEIPATVATREPDYDLAKAPTVAVDSGEEIQAEAFDELGEDEAPDEEFFKAPTIAVAEGPLEPIEDTGVDELQLAEDEIEVKSYQAPTIATDSESLGAEPAARPISGVPAVERTPRKVAEKKKWYQSNLFRVGGVFLVVLILIGIVLSSLIKTEDKAEPTLQAVVATATTRPTRVPTPTHPPEPTEIPGMAVFEHGMVLLHEEKNYKEAILRFNQAEELGFMEPQLYANRGWACHEAQFYQGECSYESAIRDYSQAIEMDPNQARFYSLRAWSFIHLENFGGAIEDYSRAIELEPENPEHWNGRGDVYARIGDLEPALEDINHAIELDPENDGYYSTRAWAYLNSGNLEAAAEDFSKAIELNPENPEYWWERGWRYLDLGRFDEAIADFDQAINLLPEALQPYIGKAHAFAQLGDYDAAIQNIDTAIDLEPRNDWLYLVRARILWWNFNEVEAAVSDLRKAIEVNPNNWEAYMNLGEIYAYHYGDLDQGIHNFNQAVKVAPRGIDTPFVVRGIYYNHVENWEMAIKDFIMAIRIFPENPEPYGHRGYAHQEMGQLDEARADYNRFLELTEGRPEYEGWRKDIENWLRNNP
jgi:serine/threonine protein kinase/tetratricopeptide (TPR) repeat protein